GIIASVIVNWLRDRK
ncbi:type I toxin-antitoxin system toxin Ldr family protein, partial [Salmonella enterica]